MIAIICLALVIAYFGVIIYFYAYNSFVGQQLSSNTNSLHFDYIGYALTKGSVVSAHSYSVPGFLGYGTLEKEDIVVFVPATEANFTESFLFCDSYNVGDSVSVLVSAYNVTQQMTFPTIPSNETTIAGSAVVNRSSDQWTTIVYDQIGRDYSVANVTSPCES